MPSAAAKWEPAMPALKTFMLVNRNHRYHPSLCLVGRSVSRQF
jgi:hypothetical protein